MLTSIFCALLFAAQPGSYLERTAVALERSREDVPAMQAMAEDVAKRICAGGKLYAGGNPSLISEMSGRAGGLMLTSALGGQAPAASDAVMFFEDADHPLPDAVAASGAAVVLFGAKEDDARVHSVPARADANGLSPTLSMAIQGWLFTAELVSACTRQGKMPVLYETIGLYGGIPRMEQYQGKGIFFHDGPAPPRVLANVLAEEYIKRVSVMLRRCEKECRSNLDRAGQWAGRAITSGAKPMMYSMGHLFPDEIEKTAIGADFRTAVWNAGFSYLPAPEDNSKKGDLVLHIGYQHPPLPMLSRAKAVGARAVYVSVLKDRDFPDGPNTVWIDPMWPWTDACVPIAGYDVPGFAASGVVNAAIAWEIERMAQGGAR